MTSGSLRIAAYDAAMTAAGERLDRFDWQGALVELARAHVLGQRDFGRHWRVHVAMLRVAWRSTDGREFRGQLMRLALTPIGHLFNRLPRGNTGVASVSAFQPMPTAPDLERLLDEKSG
jgi:hypothetical protein